jgi:hypothetical protein
MRADPHGLQALAGTRSSRTLALIGWLAFGVGSVLAILGVWAYGELVSAREVSSQVLFIGTIAGAAFGVFIGARRWPAYGFVAAIEIIGCVVLGVSGGASVGAIAGGLIAWVWAILDDSFYLVGLRIAAFGIWAAVPGAICGLVLGVRLWLRWQERRRDWVTGELYEKFLSVPKAASPDRSRHQGARGDRQHRGRR